MLFWRGAECLINAFYVDWCGVPERSAPNRCSRWPHACSNPHGPVSLHAWGHREDVGELALALALAVARSQVWGRRHGAEGQRPQTANPSAGARGGVPPAPAQEGQARSAKELSGRADKLAPPRDQIVRGCLFLLPRGPMRGPSTPRSGGRAVFRVGPLRGRGVGCAVALLDGSNCGYDLGFRFEAVGRDADVLFGAAGFFVASRSSARRASCWAGVGLRMSHRTEFLSSWWLFSEVLEIIP